MLNWTSVLIGGLDVSSFETINHFSFFPVVSMPGWLLTLNIAILRSFYPPHFYTHAHTLEENKQETLPVTELISESKWFLTGHSTYTTAVQWRVHLTS